MPENHFWWWQILKRCLLLLAQGCGLVRLVLLTPENQVHVIFFNWLYGLADGAVSLKSFWTRFTSCFEKITIEGPSVQFSATVGKVLPCSPSFGRNCFSAVLQMHPERISAQVSGRLSWIRKVPGGALCIAEDVWSSDLLREEAEPRGPCFPPRVWVGWRAGPVLVINVERCTVWILALFLNTVYQRGRYLLAQKWERSVAGLEVVVIWIFAWE